MPHLIDHMREVVRALDYAAYAGCDVDYADEHKRRVRDVVFAYDALAPDWSDAPKWAQWYAVDSHGLAAWYRTRPFMNRTIWTVNGWYGFDYETAPGANLPIGLDWRLCLWKRPAETEPTPAPPERTDSA